MFHHQSPCYQQHVICNNTHAMGLDGGWNCLTRDQSLQMTRKTCHRQKKSPKLHLQRKKGMNYKRKIQTNTQLATAITSVKTESQIHSHNKSHCSMFLSKFMEICALGFCIMRPLPSKNVSFNC